MLRISLLFKNKGMMRDIKGFFMITTQSYHAGKNNDEPLATGRPGHVTFLIPPVISRVYSEKKSCWRGLVVCTIFISSASTKELALVRILKVFSQQTVATL